MGEDERVKEVAYEDMVYACGVCDAIMQQTTPSIACNACQQWVHLKSCAGLTYKQAKKQRKRFCCSKCQLSKDNDHGGEGTSHDGPEAAEESVTEPVILMDGEKRDYGGEGTSHDGPEDENFYLKHENRNIFVGKLVPHEEGDMCHHKLIPKGHGKFIITLVFLREAISWGYDASTQTVGCFITWPMKDCRRRVPKASSSGSSGSSSVGSSGSSSVGSSASSSVGSSASSSVNFYVDEGEGMMNGNAKTITEEDLKHGRKRVSKPKDWKSEKKRKYTKGSDSKKAGSPCNCRLKCQEKITNEDRQVVFQEYCELKSLERRRDFHCRYVKQVPVQRSRVREVLKDGTANKVAIEEGSRRTLTRNYFLGEVKVCKKMYLNTLNISMQTIDTAFEKQGSVVVIEKDHRGGNNKKRVDGRTLIRQHIQRFPIKDSHYCRKQTKRKYLHEKLSVSKMYKLYRESMQQKGHRVEKLHMYIQVFNEDFNLSFFKLKKDKCCLCNALENMKLDSGLKRLIFREQDLMHAMKFNELMQYDVTAIDLLYDAKGNKEVLPEKGDEEVYITIKYNQWKDQIDGNGSGEGRFKVLDDDDDDEVDEDEIVRDLTDMPLEDVFTKWRHHLYNVELTRLLKRDSKEYAANDDETVYCCFDLQQVLECPYSNVGDLFYKRCLSSYNFVVNDTKNAHCFYWSEEHGKRGANEICTCLKLFAEEKVKLGVKHILAFADGCVGQGRNRMVAATLDHIVQVTGLESFFVCYLEKGHTENSADDVHSLIERNKVSTVNVPAEWPTLMRQIDTELVVKVKHLTHSEFLDVHDYLKGFSNFHKDATGETIINWQTVKIIRVMKSNPHVLYFKMAYQQSEYQKIDLIQVGGKRGVKRGVKRDAKRIPAELKSAYPERLPIAAAKYDDLMDMCKSLVIDEQYHDYYKNLPVQ